MKIYDPIHRNVIILKGKVLNCIFNLLHNDFKFYGRDNVITIEEETKLKKGLFLIIGDKNSFNIGKNCSFNNFTIRSDGNRNKIKIGNNVTWGGGVLNAIDHTQIKVGSECMFSYGIDIMSSDGHPIFLEGKKIRYNKSKNIEIGEHVWIGMKSQILKGVTIPDNCVIGASSLVNKPFHEENCIIGGHPAEIIRHKIYWKR